MSTGSDGPCIPKEDEEGAKWGTGEGGQLCTTSLLLPRSFISLKKT